MAAVGDEYLESPMDNDDVFPCKGCGEILEEGKAFELAGNRWHLDCFRCNTCGTLLDSDANLLLLGDGSLICNNCTYSCSACGNKIEDLAILTGDQAFCATCFRCRNCKRKIENLRYARTSQGIFCMGCHETLMARRRKKSKAASSAKSREKDQSPMVTEKSLPALPPNAIPLNAFSNDRVDPESDTPTELSPRPRPAHRHNESSSRGSSRPARSPERPDSSAKTEGLSLPATTYRKNRNSSIYQSADSGPGEGPESYFIPVALDPSPAPVGTPLSNSDNAAEGTRRKERDYFSVPKGSGSEKRDDSVASTPHIAFQEKGRQPSSDLDVARLKSAKFSKTAESDQRKASVSGDEFKLQDAPVTKKGLSTRSSSSHSSLPQDNASGKTSNGVVRKDGHSNLSEARRANESRTSEDADGARGAGRQEPAKAIPRKEVPSSAGRNGQPGSRSGQPDQAGMTDTYTQPRAAPPPPPPPAGAQAHTPRKGSAGGKEQGEPKVSPKLPRWSSGGDFSLDEDMARILGTDEGSSSILRRVSNVVRHGRTGSVESSYHHNPTRISHSRSISETTRATVSPRWPKSPMGDNHPGISHDIGSPMSMSSPENAAVLKRQLRNSEQRVAELERQFSSEKDLKNLNQKLVEKRKTVSVLDTQTEIMIRQLEVLAGYVERAKETKTPIDPRELEDSAIKEFVKKLDAVKQAMSESIENLHEERNQLVEERDSAVADRDRALMEFEQLSSKNAQLADMNNDLTHQIQERFKSQIGGDIKSPNGLGIYGASKSGAGGSSLNLDATSMTTGATLVGDEEPIVEHGGPMVVQVRKGQVKKFNWKKGSKTMAQNVAKGVNRAVVAFQQNDRERLQHQGLAGDSIGLPYNMTVAQVESASPAAYNGQNKQQLDPGRQGFGFFGKKTAMPKSVSASALATAAAAAEPASTLFGSDLVERSEFERRQIPAVITRCIEEVELRGMDQEGIYRKTGGNSQVNMIKDGFEKNENFDISDPDMDITAVTSVLKQYFRKLPIPLLTFDVYDHVLESNAIVDEAERCMHLRKTFASMPERHSDCLEFLMFHLHRVAQREPENLMSPKNLAVVFAPTIMRDLSIEREMTDMHAKNIAVQFVIENTNRIFDDS
ncbi:Rho-type gtpase-activating protein [Conoideocrella luteorostrata]|uniref:Rho-type gtpase-activating protein n=1 Tax=Conoideocrella luteorostrata TaxID=1105319 RepID=A0AAJ0CHJ6_9HYPO|nr:Rho-type gtpase-activating protein [Conoideocrella luteorostrata]